MNKFLEDNGGKKSSMRLIWGFTIITIIATWSVVSILTKVMQPIDPTLGLIVASAFGAKTWQKYIETKNGQ